MRILHGDMMVPADSIKKLYAEQGYFFPLEVLFAEDADLLGRQLVSLGNSDWAKTLGYRGQLSQLHAISPAVNKLIRNPVILAAVESILGPDLMVWGSSVFMKPGNSPGFVSWHQDLTYWGLNNDREVAVWIALGPVNRDNGCMRFVRGSHKRGQLAHSDTFDETNILTRGQHVDLDIDEQDVVYVELEPGQASMHHGHLVHASGPNTTDQPRMGIVVNYIATSVSQAVAKSDYAMLVRGEDRFHNFLHLPEPKGELDEDAMHWHHRIMTAHQEALYDGAENQDSSPLTG